MNHIDIMKQALDVLNFLGDTGDRDVTPHVWIDAGAEDAVTALRAAIAQPESEPAAWLVRWLTTEKQRINKWVALELENYSPNPSREEIPLYAEPVHDYVALTDEQIDLIYKTETDQSLRPQDYKIARGFARAIEKAVRGES